MCTMSVTYFTQMLFSNNLGFEEKSTKKRTTCFMIHKMVRVALLSLLLSLLL